MKHLWVRRYRTLERWGRSNRAARVLACVLITIAVALALSASMAPAVISSAAHFPHVAPARLAHLLADISAHTLNGPWSLDEESGNYSSWQYAVSYACGDRCVGRARVSAMEAGVPRHGLTARIHSVMLVREQCTSIPMLPWPAFCEKLEIESVVNEDGNGGSWLRETVVVRCACSILPAPAAMCAAPSPNAVYTTRLQSLRSMLSPTSAA
ncbi:hypothetical protein ACJJTC_003408 [Scirpophaga incertulas]